MISINNEEPKAIYVGSTPVKKVYAGSILIWPSDKYTLTISSKNADNKTLSKNGGEIDINLTLYKNGQFISGARNDFEILVLGETQVYLDHVIQDSTNPYYTCTLYVAGNTDGWTKNVLFKILYKDLASSNLLSFVQEADPNSNTTIPVDQRYMFIGYSSLVQSNEYGDEYNLSVYIKDSLMDEIIKDSNIINNIISTPGVHYNTSYVESLNLIRTDTSTGASIWNLKIKPTDISRLINIGFATQGSILIEDMYVFTFICGSQNNSNKDPYYIEYEIHGKNGDRISELDISDYDCEKTHSCAYVSLDTDHFVESVKLYNDVQGRHLCLDEDLYYVKIRILDKYKNPQNVRNHLPENLGGNNSNNTDGLKIYPVCVTDISNDILMVTLDNNGEQMSIRDNARVYDYINVNYGSTVNKKLNFSHFDHTEFSEDYTEAKVFFKIDDRVVWGPFNYYRKFGWIDETAFSIYVHGRPFLLNMYGEYYENDISVGKYFIFDRTIEPNYTRAVMQLSTYKE